MTFVAMSVAGLSCLLSHDLGSSFRMPPAFTDYLTPGIPSEADIQMNLHEVTDIPELRDEQLVYDPGGVWRLYQEPPCATYTADFYYYRSQPMARMIVNSDWSESQFREKPFELTSYRTRCFGGMGLLFGAHILVHGGAVLHASGIDDNGKGILFAAHSGTGKSTQAAIWAEEPGVVRINDDRMAACCAGNKAYIYGIPWGGSSEVTLNHAAPLNAIVLLEQAPDNRLISLSPSEALPHLMSCAFLPYWNSSEMNRAICVLEELLARAPVFRLKCRPERAVIPLLRSAM